MTFDSTLREMEDELGGFGPTRVQSIAETFESEAEFAGAARAAYMDRETALLEEVPKIGSGYALTVARWYASREGWSGGDAEPHVFPVRTGSEAREQLSSE